MRTNDIPKTPLERFRATQVYAPSPIENFTSIMNCAGWDDRPADICFPYQEDIAVRNKQIRWIVQYEGFIVYWWRLAKSGETPGVLIIQGWKK